MPRGETSNEYLKIDPSKYDKLTDMPLVTTGCDSYVAWDPRCKHLVKEASAEELAESLTALIPTGNWKGIDLVITGGEPMLGWQKAYPALLDILIEQGLSVVTFETNTTQPLQEDFKEYLQKSNLKVIWSCSPKLSASGESREQAIKPRVARQYFDIANSSMYFKFVVDQSEDQAEIKSVLSAYESEGVQVPVYVMPVGGCLEEYKHNARTVAELAMEHGWRYSPRLHSDLFGNGWET